MLQKDIGTDGLLRQDSQDEQDGIPS
jgi:hypothetical protein